jgi:signal transduction histidine kinase
MDIGLSVSRSIIENHGGKLWAEANDGPGATFLFSAPCLSDGATGDRVGDAGRAAKVADARDAMRNP